METIKCYRFVKDDLSSENGQMTWEIGEWNKVSGKITCCSNGLHASLTPRDSMRNVYGQRWFISEARGEIDKLDSKFAAREMRIIQEIPTEVLQKFAIWCSQDCLEHYEKRFPEDKRVRDCIQAAENYLLGKIKVDELIKKRELASAALIGGGTPLRAASVAIAAAISIVAPNVAAWTAAATAAAFSTNAMAVATDAAIASANALAAAHNVTSVAAAATTSATAASLASIAAAAGAAAHAASVTAARNKSPIDTVSDAYYSAFAAYSTYAIDSYYTKQDKNLLELIG